jgi:hypothetical protein
MTVEDGLLADLHSASVSMPTHMRKHRRQRMEAQQNRRIAVGTEQSRRIDLDQYYASQRKRIQNDAIPVTTRVLLSNTSASQRIVLLVSVLFLGWCVGTSALGCSIQPSTPMLPAVIQVRSASLLLSIMCGVSALDMLSLILCI